GCEERQDALVVVDTVERRNERVVPPVVLQQLAASLPVRLEVGIGRVQNRRELRLGLLMGLVVRRVPELERLPIPIRIGEDEPFVVCDRNRKRIRKVTIRPERLAGESEAGVELRAARRILEPAVHAPSHLDLSRRETRFSLLAGLARQRCRIERTQTWIL